jgi:hypothetical protein
MLNAQQNKAQKKPPVLKQLVVFPDALAEFIKRSQAVAQISAIKSLSKIM